MPRPLRPDLHGAWFHVINRGADRQDIFSCAADYRYFQSLLAEATNAHDTQIHAYALMTTHYHLLLHCPTGGLSAAMKDVQSTYVGTYNHQHDRSGPMFEGRFKSFSADSPSARHLTGRYIHRNPLDIVPVAELARYRWSSFGAYVGERPAPTWLRTDELAAQFDDAAGYTEYVTTRHHTDKQADRVGVGGAGSVGALIDLDCAVASVCGVTVEAIMHHQRGRNTARLLAVTLAVELRLMRSAGLADHYGLQTAASVRATARRGRVRLADDPEFAALRAAVLGAGMRNVTKGA
jgi:REP element-mobilizing transposase RayT